jgi:hypothetical protein
MMWRVSMTAPGFDDDRMFSPAPITLAAAGDAVTA